MSKAGSALPLKAVERILKDAGASRVSKEATTEFATWLEGIAREISGEAAALARHAGRKTMTENDVALAVRRARRR
jgi:histone H3/H4